PGPAYRGADLTASENANEISPPAPSGTGRSANGRRRPSQRASMLASVDTHVSGSDRHMSNHIIQVDVHDHALSPVAGEVRVVVRTGFRTPATAVRGRLMGPHCRFAETVEVAYPMRPVPTPALSDQNELVCRVVVPEVSLWDPQSPFLYAGPVELWEGDERV